MTPANILRQARESSGLSVRNLAEAAGVSASTVHRIEQGKMAPTVEMLERLVAVAGESLRVTSVPDYTSSVIGLVRELPIDEVNAIRKVAEFVTRFWASDEQRSRMINATPGKPSGERWDTFVAALAEWLAVTARIATPPWVVQRKALPEAWWVSPMQSMQAWEYAGTPAAFQSRNVYIHRESLVNV